MTFKRLALFLLMVVSTAAAFGQEVLTNDSVVKMTKAHLSEQTIVDLIQNSPGRYVVTASALISLKQQGVSDEAISAMRARMARKPGASPSPRVPAAARWEIHDSKDEITGESKFEATLTEKAGRQGTFEATATCPAIGLAFKIVYLSSVDPNPGYKMTDGNFLLRKPHVVMRLAIDGNSGTAPSTTSDFLNEATLWFQRKLSDGEKKDIGTAVMGGLLSLTSPATPADVYSAKLIKVELPLGNGELPILEIHPQDPEFRQFAARCNAAEEESARAEKEEEESKNAAAVKMQQRQAAAAAPSQGAMRVPGSGYAVLTSSEDFQVRSPGHTLGSCEMTQQRH